MQVPLSSEFAENEVDSAHRGRTCTSMILVVVHVVALAGVVVVVVVVPVHVVVVILHILLMTNSAKELHVSYSKLSFLD